jgi:hypothetical protein
MNPGTEVGSMPAKVSEKILPTVTAGLAKDVLLVNQYAAPMYAPTAAADTAARPVRARVKISAISPAVATTSPTRWPVVLRSLVAISNTRRSNMMLARTAPTTPPTIWATV